MEECQKRYITANLWELVKLTSCNTTCISILIQNGCLSDGDVAELKSIPNELTKTEKLYELLLIKKGSYIHLKSALKEDCQTGALEILNKLCEEAEGLGATGTVPKEMSRRKPPIRFGVIAPVLNFTGREPQLSQLHQKLHESEGKRAVLSQMASVVGLGGIGKTELARKYAQEYGEQFYDGNLIWISAQTEESLRQSFTRLASDHLSLSLNNVDKQKLNICGVVDQIYAFFNEQKVLFIFDNAESADYLQKFMPFRLSSSLPYILITSRDREWSFSVPVLELDEMTEQEAMCFVKRSLQMEHDDDEVLKLVDRLQRFPLALSQAVSFINQRRLLGDFSITQYLDKFEANSEKLLDSKKTPAELSTYRETTFTTWRITTHQISSNEENGRCAMEILHSIAYFPPDKIGMSVFSALCDGDEYLAALHLLVKYSMLNVQQKEKTVSVHRLVQEVTRHHLAKTNEEFQALRIALFLSSSRIFLGDENSAFLALSAYKFSVSLLPELSIEFKSLPWRIVQVLLINKRNRVADKVGKELEEQLSSLLPHKNCDVIRLKHMMVMAAYALQENLEGGLETLQKLVEHVMENDEDSFTEDETLSIECTLGGYLRKLGRHKESLDLCRKIFERRKQIGGLNDWQSIDSLIDLVKCIFKVGTEVADLSENDIKLFRRELCYANSVMKDAHQTNLELVGKDFAWTTTMCNVAHCFDDMCERDYASQVYSDIIQRSIDSEENRFLQLVIVCMRLLGNIKESEGKHEEALVLCQNVHSKLVDLNGEMDEETLEAQHTLAAALLMVNEVEKAVETYTDILKILGRKMKLPASGDVLPIHVQLVDIVCQMEDSKTYLEQLERMEEKMETEFGESHPLLETVKRQIEVLSRETLCDKRSGCRLV